MVDPQDNNSGRDEHGKFKKGNPGGPGGSQRRAETRRAVEEAVSPEHLKAIMRKLTHESIQKGNTKAADIVLKYTVGLPAGATQEPEPLHLPIPDLNSPAACAKAAEVVVSAINQGAVHSDTANVLINGIKAHSELMPPSGTALPSDDEPQQRAIPYEVIRVLFRRFKRTGLLPDDPQEAGEVIERVKAGLDLPDEETTNGPMSILADGFIQRERKPAEVMDALLDEAAYAPAHVPFVRTFARFVLISLADFGANLTGNCFPTLPMPAFGPVGIAVVDFANSIVRRPDTKQARRLLARMESIRRRAFKEGRDYDEWMQRLRDAALCFHQTGGLPDEDDLREATLAVHEFAMLGHSTDGEDVRDLLQLFDEAAQASEEKRSNAIRQLQAMAKAGRLRAPGLMAG